MSNLVLDSASRWFGNVVAVNDVSMTIGPGVTGLLGPNGAGKTTLMAMMSGFLAPSAGHVTLDGMPVWRNTETYRQIGLVPERELSFGYLTGRQFVRANADLHRLPDAAVASTPTPRACASASRSPRHWSTTRPCCCSTSRSTASTPVSGCT
jgi:ABC-2 type transport system ATP-binding protein